MNKQIKKNKKGFTLVEMIVVIAIIGVLAAMMVPSLLGYIQKANTSNNRAAATNVGRMSQAVLAEMNEAALTQDYEGTTSGSTVTVARKGGSAHPADAEFISKLEEMFDTNFKGCFKISVTSGSTANVIYSPGSTAPAPSWPTPTYSTKEYGVYPEN